MYRWGVMGGGEQSGTWGEKAERIIQDSDNSVLGGSILVGKYVGERSNRRKVEGTG